MPEQPIDHRPRRQPGLQRDALEDRMRLLAQGDVGKSMPGGEHPVPMGGDARALGPGLIRHCLSSLRRLENTLDIVCRRIQPANRDRDPAWGRKALDITRGEGIRAGSPRRSCGHGSEMA